MTKITFYAPNFYPMIGGLEHVAMSLATVLSHLGYQVQVLTQTPSDQPDSFPFTIIRGATFWQTVRYIRQSDVFVQFNISLAGIVPWLLTGRPLVATHHGLYHRTLLTGQLKWATTRLATINTGCSQFISQQYRRGQWLPNPYDDSVFQQQLSPDQPRQEKLVFLGRLVSEKGCDVLLQALVLLKQTTNLTPELTIIGDGPERQALQRLVICSDLAEQVTFAGSQTEAVLAATLNQHAVLIVPSVYAEPFGIVALEAIACGCFVIGTATGGLPEAIGPCGVTFPMSDARALARLLAKALNEPAWREAHLAHAPAHLASHTQASVASRFLHILDTTL